MDGWSRLNINSFLIKAFWECVNRAEVHIFSGREAERERRGHCRFVNFTTKAEDPFHPEIIELPVCLDCRRGLGQTAPA